MDIQSVIQNQLKVDRRAKFDVSSQLSLGELIARLEAVQDLSKQVIFDFDTALCPGNLSSWRGAYDELAIEPINFGPSLVSDLRAKLKAAIGKSFTGYKGGDYVMGKTTPVWVSSWGQADERGVTGVSVAGVVSLQTARFEY